MCKPTHNPKLDQEEPDSSDPTLPEGFIPSVRSEQVFAECVASSADGFFNRNCEERDEIIAGLIREGQLGAFAGPFGMGKSPTLADVMVRVVHGVDWCERKTAKRPVIVFDCETAGPDYKKAIRAISGRLGVPVPRGPEELEVYLERDSLDEPATAALLKAVSQPGHAAKLELIRAALSRKPNALVLIDPLEMLFRLDTSRKADILALYRELRTLLSEFPKAAMLCTTVLMFGLAWTHTATRSVWLMESFADARCIQS